MYLTMPETPEQFGLDSARAGSRFGEAMRASLERELAGAPADGAGAPPPVPDHTLLQRIGSGAYGEVWLARNALGTLRAVKVVRRARFKEDRPYEREFNGILKCEPVSRSHEGLVQVLHVGRDDARGCFYYVMELADSVSSSEFGVPSSKPASLGAVQLGTRNTEPGASYAPRTLRSELARQQRLLPVEAAQWVLRLAGALAHLHAHGLVHRDIKPSNVIFVGGQPKLADIGLVTDVGSSQSFVGTEGFIPPEGPGTPQADLYGLGKLLYELATGRDRMDFPQLPPLPPRSHASETAANPAPGDDGRRFTAAATVAVDDSDALYELNEVMTRACAPDPKHRYASATELQADLNLFLAGRSLRHARHIERALARLKRFAVAACVGLVLAAGVIWFVKNEERHANGRARAEARSREQETALRQRAESAERATQQQLYTALLEQARATVLSGETGQRVRALDAIQRAAAISNSAELRREVCAALARPDLRFERELPFGEEFTLRALDPAFGRIAVGRGRGPVEIRSVADDALLATLPASTNLPVYVAEWSTDGRFLAIKRDYPGGGLRSDREIWELPPASGAAAGARRILLLKDVPRDAVAFHPRLEQIFVGRRTEAILRDLPTGDDLDRLRLPGTPSRLRFSPEGERFAALCAVGGAWRLSVHDATNGALLASQDFGANLANFNWHPGGRWLAVCDHSGLVQAMDATTGELQPLGRHKSEAVAVEFSADGAWLTSDGWGRELICWDARTRQRAFVIRLDSTAGQFRADGRAYAVQTRSGLRLHTFERPIGYREFTEDLGTRLQQAAFSSDGRWLAASGERRLGVWDLTANSPGALDEQAHDAHSFFTADASELFASRNRGVGDNAAFRWRLTPATVGGEPPALERLALPRLAGFNFLSLHSNSVVLTTTSGTQLLAPGEIETGHNDWQRTIAGRNRASPDGRWLGVLPHYTSSLQVYALPGLEPVARLTRLPALGNINFFEFSPAGDEVSLYSSRGVELWSTATWERTRVLTNFSRPFLYAPDGRSLWLTKGLRDAGLYDARTLEPRLLLPTGMLPLAVTPDGRQLAVSIDGQRLQVWDLAALREQFRALGVDWAEASRQ